MQATAIRSGGDGWSAARVFLAVSAVWHIPLGVAGLAIDQTFPIRSADAATSHSAHIFGVFETNGWHSLLALLLGVVSSYFMVRPRRAREVALVIGLSHVGVVLALVIWHPSTFLLASNVADQVAHASTAIGGILGSLLTPRTIEARPA
jgi:hypothetical protein